MSCRTLSGCGANHHGHKDATTAWYHCTNVIFWKESLAISDPHDPQTKLSTLKTQKTPMSSSCQRFSLVHLATEVSARTQTLTRSSWKPGARNHGIPFRSLQKVYQREVPILFGSLRLWGNQGKSSTGNSPLPMPTVDSHLNTCKLTQVDQPVFSAWATSRWSSLVWASMSIPDRNTIESET